MKRRYKVLIFFVVIIGVLIVSFSIYNSDMNRIKRRYDIDIPKSSELLHYNDDIGWFGEGAIFTELSMESEDLEELFDELKSTKPYYKTIDEMKEDIDQLVHSYYRDNPEDFMIDWENDIDIILGENNNSFYYVFDYDSNTLYIIEQVW